MHTLPLLRLLDNSPKQSLSRGEIRLKGIDDHIINEAYKLQQVIITVVGCIDDLRQGELSSSATIMLTDTGENVLDENE
jgi:hypothetical protein